MRKNKIVILLVLLIVLSSCTSAPDAPSDRTEQSVSLEEAFSSEESTISQSSVDGISSDSSSPSIQSEEDFYKNYDYIEMTNGTEDIPTVALRVGDTFMDMTVARVENEEVLLLDEVVKTKLIIMLEGEVTLKGTFKHNTSEGMADELWFIVDEDSLSNVPKDKYGVIYIGAFWVVNRENVWDQINQTNFVIQYEIKTSFIELYYAEGSGSYSSIEIGDFEILS